LAFFNLKGVYMKKTLIAIAAMAFIGAASAVEVGVFGGEDASHQDSGLNHSLFGASVGEHFGPVSATAEFARKNEIGTNQNRSSLVAGYDVATVGTVTVTPKVGGTFVDNEIVQSGYALRYGVGASVPLASKVAGTVDVYRLQGDSRITSQTGNTVTAGVRFSF
jgi:hypothetical protein